MGTKSWMCSFAVYVLVTKIINGEFFCYFQWSFGVTMWELATLAQQPYVEIDHGDLFAFLKMGYRLSQPVNCPDEL